MSEKSILKPPVFVAGLLVLATLAVYLPVGAFRFIYFDDPAYVFENPRVRAGLTLDGVLWAFTHGHASNWHPVTWISHMLDCQVFGLNAGGHHLTNVFFHCANTVLLFVLLRKLTRSTWPGAFVAALFALHPLHIESVAWVAERKDVLSTFFGLLCLISYSECASRRPESPPGSASSWSGYGEGRYRLTLILFLLALMSKPMLVTLPCVMLLLDWWPLRRYAHDSSGWWASSRHLLVEKLPFFALSACSSVITLVVQKNGGAVAALEHLPLDTRLANATVSYLRYIGKLFWPCDLAVLYPYCTWPVLSVALAAAAVLSITLFAVMQRQKRPYLLVGWCWYLCTLIPVIGIVQVGAQSIADRYTYFPSIGLFVLLVWAAAELAAVSKRMQFAGAAAGLSALTVLAFAAQTQLRRWHDTETLFRHTLAVTSRNSRAYNELGRYMAALSDWKTAESCYRTAISIEPGFPNPWNNLACILIDQGRPAEAIADCQMALRLRPAFPEAHNNLGTALLNAGRPREAAVEYQRALALRPDYEQAHFNFGNALAALGDGPAALQHYRAAIRLNPCSANAHNNCGFLLLSQGKFAEAAAEFQATLRIAPGFWQAQVGLSKASAAQTKQAAAAVGVH